MEKRCYTAEVLEGELREFEQRFGMDTEAFYVAHMRHETPAPVDPSAGFVWAQTYRDARRLRGQWTSNLKDPHERR